MLEWLEQQAPGEKIAVIGHRVVHGGEDFSRPLLVTESILKKLETLVPLAPLHQPHNLSSIRTLVETMPHTPQVACFDTAFHRTQSEVAQAFALPKSLTEQGLRRYGFHGLSYEYVAATLPDVVGDAAHGRVIVAHLGNGASMCAMRGLKSVATTMGFSTLEGLPMGSRCAHLRNRGRC